MSESLNRQLLRMTTLLQLEQRARRAARDELAFLMVNETAALVPYHQAVLWQCGRKGKGRVAAVSGLAVPDRDGPYLLWLRRVLRTVAGGPNARTIHALTAEDLTVAGEVDPAAGWRDWLPAHALWVPLIGPLGDLPGGMLLVRQDPWSE